MHIRRLSLFALLLILPLAAWAQSAGHDPAAHARHGAPPAGAADAPYAGLETREIKALSADQQRQLQEGSGMGLALAAELNHHPGPRHVLDLAAELNLSAEQHAATQSLFDSMRAEAVRLGTAILAQERELDTRFAHGHLDVATLEQLTTEIGRLQGRLRATHLRTHLEMRRLLTPEQIATYDRLRGYRL